MSHRCRLRRRQQRYCGFLACYCRVPFTISEPCAKGPGKSTSKRHKHHNLTRHFSKAFTRFGRLSLPDSMACPSSFKRAA